MQAYSPLNGDTEVSDGRPASANSSRVRYVSFSHLYSHNLKLCIVK